MSKQEQDYLEKLSILLSKEGKKQVIATVKKVASSGMSRQVAFAIVINEDVHFITYFISKALGLRYNESNNTITISGCGMDVIFGTLYNLNVALMKYELDTITWDLVYNYRIPTTYSLL